MISPSYRNQFLYNTALCTTTLMGHLMEIRRMQDNEKFASAIERYTPPVQVTEATRFNGFTWAVGLGSKVMWRIDRTTGALQVNWKEVERAAADETQATHWMALMMLRLAAGAVTELADDAAPVVEPPVPPQPGAAP